MLSGSHLNRLPSSYYHEEKIKKNIKFIHYMKLINKCIGKSGTREREKFEFKLRLELRKIE